MKLTLVNPPVSRRYVSAVDEPLGLEYLAAACRDLVEVNILDAFGLRLDMAQCIDVVEELRPDVLGIGLVFAAALNPTLELARAVKERLPGLTIVLGGNTATFLAERLCMEPSVDYVVRGEADATFPELLRTLISGRSPGDIPGLAFAHNGKAALTPPAPLIDDLDALPFPAREALPFPERYTRSVLSARGCSYGCIYCSATAFWQRRTRMRGVDSILEEVDVLTDSGRGYFSFCDDCFTIRPERTMAVCDGLKALNRNLTWSCTGRIETISPKLLDAMGSTGCRMIFFGVESGSARILSRLNRRYTPDRVREVYAMCLDHGILPSFSFIVGLPFEEDEDRKATRDLIGSLEGVESGVHILTPFPGTPIADSPEEFGLTIKPHDVGDLDINTHSVVETHLATGVQTMESFYDAMGTALSALRRKGRFIEHWRPRQERPVEEEQAC